MNVVVLSQVFSLLLPFFLFSHTNHIEEWEEADGRKGRERGGERGGGGGKHMDYSKMRRRLIRAWTSTI